MSRLLLALEFQPLGESFSRSKAPGASWAVDPSGGRGHPTARQCQGKVRDGARRLGRPFRARGPFRPESQGVALGWPRPRRWRSEAAPYGAHQNSTAPPRRHRKKSPKGHSSMRNSLIIHTRNVAKWPSGGHVSPSPGPHPRSLRPNGAKCDSPGQRPGSGVRKNSKPCRGALTTAQMASPGLCSDN